MTPVNTDRRAVALALAGFILIGYVWAFFKYEDRQSRSYRIDPEELEGVK